jgi:hypothetical protein
VVFLLSSFSFGEVFKTSAFKKMNSRFEFKRDLFTPKMKTVTLREEEKIDKPTPVEEKKIQEELEKKAKEQYIRQNISYEGYTLRTGRYLCLIQVDGEYFIGAEGDIAADNILILKINSMSIKVKIAGKELDIFLRE